MQSDLCDGILDRSGKKIKTNGLKTADSCDHSYCQVRRQKKENGCVDIPPKGLPWASGLLKYLPGQRNFYTDLYLKQQIELEAAKLAKKNCPPKKAKRKSESENQDCSDMGGGTKTFTCCCCPVDNGNGNGNGKCNGKKKKKGKKGKGKKNGCMTCCCVPDDNGTPETQENGNGPSQSPPQPCCIEFEEVMICDGCSEPRKGFLLRPSQRPEAQEAAQIATDQIQNSAEEEADRGMICLCIPRSYLKRQSRNGEEEGIEDMCAKFAIKECPEEENKDENKENSKGDKEDKRKSIEKKKSIT